MIHTKTPSSEEYNMVCRKLIEKYPKLKDEIGSTGYVMSYFSRLFVHVAVGLLFSV